MEQVKRYLGRASIVAGFSLLELIIVIATLIFLASILSPIIIQAKEAAKQAKCLSELKQVALATVMYTNDYDDNYPFWSMADPLNATRTPPYKQRYWFGGYVYPTSALGDGLPDPMIGALYPYKKNPDILACPSFAAPAYFSTQILLGYAVNGKVMPNAGVKVSGIWIPNTPTNASHMDRPAETVLMADSAFSDPFVGLEGNPLLGYDVTSDFPAFHGRHRGRCNIAWADGHAKRSTPSIRPESLWPLPSIFVPDYSDSFEANHIGDLLHPDYPYSVGEPDVSYYLNLQKPKS